ncbi:hypothetical protein POM88_042918 [Heracleum sosnowskyi]|uniref:Uncharacterized protein n=1 Tax=Heracleum sosnowskyi TaxID=360622 RepID=A0AAD8HHC5_9APIA|nr:hypothetical protein POM88_042918 [Heracleum sosnowskyi]
MNEQSEKSQTFDNVTNSGFKHTYPGYAYSVSSNIDFIPRKRGRPRKVIQSTGGTEHDKSICTPVIKKRERKIDDVIEVDIEDPSIVQPPLTEVGTVHSTMFQMPDVLQKRTALLPDTMHSTNHHRASTFSTSRTHYKSMSFFCRESTTDSGGQYMLTENTLPHEDKKNMDEPSAKKRGRPKKLNSSAPILINQDVQSLKKRGRPKKQNNMNVQLNCQPELIAGLPNLLTDHAKHCAQMPALGEHIAKMQNSQPIQMLQSQEQSGPLNDITNLKRKSHKTTILDSRETQISTIRGPVMNSQYNDRSLIVLSNTLSRTPSKTTSKKDGIPVTNPHVDSDFDDDFHYLLRSDNDLGSDSDTYIPAQNQHNETHYSSGNQFSEFINKPPVSSMFEEYHFDNPNEEADGDDFSSEGQSENVFSGDSDSDNHSDNHHEDDRNGNTEPNEQHFTTFGEQSFGTDSFGSKDPFVELNVGRRHLPICSEYRSLGGPTYKCTHCNAQMLDQGHTLRLGGRLYHQFIVDAFSAVEQSRLWFGKCLSVMYVVEYQKRGLPHAHIGFPKQYCSSTMFDEYGPDRATVMVQGSTDCGTENNKTRNEIKMYLDGRYVCGAEATHRMSMSDDILSKRRKLTGKHNLSLSDKELENYTLGEIEHLLNSIGRSLKNYPTLSMPPARYLDNCKNKLVLEETTYCEKEMTEEHQRLVQNLNYEQKRLINSVFPDLHSRFTEVSYLRERAILTPTNKVVDHVNDIILEKIEGTDLHTNFKDLSQ